MQRICFIEDTVEGIDVGYGGLALWPGGTLVGPPGFGSSHFTLF